MMDGIWTAEFSTSRGGTGAGVVVVEHGMARGGDSNYLYRGKLVPGPGGTLTAEMDVHLHTSHHGAHNALGGPHVNIALAGTQVGDRIALHGSHKGVQVDVKLLRVGVL